ncbi:hypothetical protein Tco_0060295 [Tanacetum coccineum]
MDLTDPYTLISLLYEANNKTLDPSVKPRKVKNTKLEIMSGATWSNSQDFRKGAQNEFRLKHEAVQEMYTMTKANDVTIMKLEEMKFLITTSIVGLTGEDAMIINMQNQEIRQKYRREI